MVDFLKNEWKFLVLFVFVLAVTVFVYSEYQQWKQHVFESKNIPPVININTDGQPPKPGEPQIVYVQGQNTHTQEIVYVPKEIDPATGQQEKTDVQFEKRESKVYVKVNGKEFEVPTDVQEDAKFQNGKLVITEDTQMRLNITAPKPSFNLGVGWSKEGPAAQINGPLYKNASWWVYGDKKTVAGGVQFPIMK